MKKGLLLAVVILLMAITASARYSSFNRLQNDGMIEDLTGGWSQYRLRAICDTGNGTMIYLAQSNGGSSPAVSPVMVIQPNGCKRVTIKAEEDK